MVFISNKQNSIKELQKHIYPGFRLDIIMKNQSKNEWRIFSGFRRMFYQN